MPIIGSTASISKNGFEAIQNIPPETLYDYFSATSGFTDYNVVTNLQNINGTMYQTVRNTSVSGPYPQYVTSLDSSGNITNVLPNIIEEYPLGNFCIDSTGNIHACYYNLVYENIPYIILQKYNSSGTVITTTQIELSTSTSNPNPQFLAFYIDTNDNLYVYTSLGTSGSLQLTKLNTSYSVLINTEITSTINDTVFIGNDNGNAYFITGYNDGTYYYTLVTGVNTSGIVLFNKLLGNNLTTLPTSFTGCVGNGNVYVACQNNLLVSLSLTTGNTNYAYSIGVPTGDTGYLSMFLNGYGNLILASNSTTTFVPINSNNPSISIGNPIKYSWSSTQTIDFGFVEVIGSDNYNVYLGCRLANVTVPQYDCAIVIKLPPTLNLITSTNLDFTLNGNLYTGTLTSASTSVVSISSSSITSSNITTSNTTVSSSTSSPTISTTSTSLVNYNQQIS